MARLAARQHGVVARRQLRGLGYTDAQIKRAVQLGLLLRVHRGVYAVGHARLTQKGRWMAAVLACGPNAVLSHRAAAALSELRPIPSGPIDVTVPATGRRRRQGIRVHVSTGLARQDVRVIDGIPVTAVPRLLLDLAETVHRQQLRLAIEAAQRRDLLDRRAIESTLARSQGRRGIKPLLSALEEIARRGEAPWTQSENENRMLALIREAGLPEPSANVMVAGFLVDLHWPRERVVVEVDSWTFHKTPAKFESDRRQDAKLQRTGEAVIRATADRIHYEPRELIDDIAGLLASRRRDAAGSQ